MASFAELRYSPASSTNTQIRQLPRRSCVLQTALDPQIGVPQLGTLQFEANVGAFGSCCALTVGLTEELVPIHVQESPSSSAEDSESSPDEILSPKTEPLELSEELSSPTTEPVNDGNEDIDALAAELQECSKAKDIASGEELHSHIIGCGLDCDTYLCNHLVLMYGHCGFTEAAEAVFLKIPSPNIYSSNIMVNAYVQNNEFRKAKIAFGNMPIRNVTSWNTIISALAKNGLGKDALQYYNSMLADGFQPNVVTFVSAVDACADAAELYAGMKLHSAILACGHSSDIVIATALINMYGKCGSLDSARDVFRQLPSHDVTSWSAMMAACADNGRNEEAFEMFDQMQSKDLKPSRSTFLAILSACSNLKDLSKGYKIHAGMLSDDIESEIKIENALINMYGKCQSLPDGVSIFHKMLQRNIITWSTMIAAHADNEKNEEALELFYLVQAACGNPNNFTFSIAFDVCANLQALEEGHRIHEYSVCTGVEMDFIAVIALINMYGKCNSLEDATVVFRRFKDRRVHVWNAIISACVFNGQDKEALRLVEEMQSEGIKPNSVTLKLIDDLSTDQGWKWNQVHPCWKGDEGFVRAWGVDG